MKNETFTASLLLIMFDEYILSEEQLDGEEVELLKYWFVKSTPPENLFLKFYQDKSACIGSWSTMTFPKVFSNTVFS